jgi:hypothetical protein
MIKTLGFGRRSESVSHEDCIEHHRETHSKLGLKQAEHLGKYVLYYFSGAMSGNGLALTDFPWDMAAIEWFLEDERWHNLQKWWDKDPDGQVIKADEARFLDRDRTYLFACDENDIVDHGSRVDDVNVLRVLKLRGDCDPQVAIRQHKDLLVPLIQNEFGSSLRRYVSSYVSEVTCLGRGQIPVSPADIIERYKLDRLFMERFEEIDSPFNSKRILDCEFSIVDRDQTIIFTGEEVVYL